MEAQKGHALFLLPLYPLASFVYTSLFSDALADLVPSVYLFIGGFVCHQDKTWELELWLK